MEHCCSGKKQCLNSAANKATWCVWSVLFELRFSSVSNIVPVSLRTVLPQESVWPGKALGTPTHAKSRRNVKTPLTKASLWAAAVFHGPNRLWTMAIYSKAGKGYPANFDFEAKVTPESLWQALKEVRMFPCAGWSLWMTAWFSVEEDLAVCFVGAWTKVSFLKCCQNSILTTS